MRFTNSGVFSEVFTTILELMMLRVISVVCQLRVLAVWAYVYVVYVCTRDICDFSARRGIRNGLDMTICYRVLFG